MWDNATSRPKRICQFQMFTSQQLRQWTGQQMSWVQIFLAQMWDTHRMEYSKPRWSPSPTHEAHWSRPSFLDASHHRTRSVKDWPVVTCTVIERIYKKKKFVEKCQSDKGEAVIYISYLDYGMNIADLQVDTLWVHVGGNEFLLGKDESKVDWKISRRFRCIKTEDQNTCNELEHLGNHFTRVDDKKNPTVWLCCHWGPESDTQGTGLQPIGR